jgi:mycothiol synthase
MPRGDSREAIDATTAAACRWLRLRGVKVCQAYAPASELADMAPLERCGFRHVTQLSMLRRELDPSFDVPSASVRVSPWIDAPTAEQLRVLLATHEGTLDCPELNAARTPEEILAGFRPTVLEDRSWWSAFDERAALVGVVLFEGGEAGVLELAYLGLVPAARGRGLAGPLLRFADQVAAAGGFRSIHVSVDAHNAPAVKLYTRHGFVEYDRREVWLAHLNEPEA